MAVFSLAARMGEYDPRKIASLPADILLYWQAWFSLVESVGHIPAPGPSASHPPSLADQQCADVMRILGQ
ncbi:TPA: hypothetical protein QHX44_000287 [Klebsiella oxytoca]|nr:hypothetical protein [Klebsiella oxytoca]